MNRKIVLSILVCIVLSSGIFMASSMVEYSSTSSETTMSVVPAVFCNHVVDVGETFALNLTVADVVDLYAWQIEVYFDPAMLNLTHEDVGKWLPSGCVFPYEEPGTGGLIVLAPVIDYEVGYLHWGISNVGTIPTFSGSGTLCQINFTAVGPGVSLVELDDEGSILVDSNVEMIPSVKIGTFIDVGGQLSPRTWTVDDDGPADFQSIQEAINAATCGDEIYVRTGTYVENLVVNKTVSITGEDKETAVIDGEENTVINIMANNVKITGFTIRNGWSGIYVGGFHEIEITENIITSNIGTGIGDGIYMVNSHSNTVSHNIISENTEDGLTLAPNSTNNMVSANVIFLNGGAGVYMHDLADANIITSNNITLNGAYGLFMANVFDNKIYHNNFINNTWQVLAQDAGDTTWHDGYPSGGNYWSDYNGTDNCWGQGQDLKGCDMMGDTTYIIDENNSDQYPLMKPWRVSKPPITEFPDLDGDGYVGITDLYTVAKYFGKEFEDHCE